MLVTWNTATSFPMTVNNKSPNGASLSYRDDHKQPMAAQQDLAARLGSMNLSEGPLATPDPDVCLTHLRLLSAFEKLKTRVGFHDGLWDVWDNRASSAGNSLDVIAKLREKRWAIYVARAVDRYESWWKSFGPNMLLEKDMAQGSPKPERYERFMEAKPLVWKAEMLPPMDVLLAWHAHMLNPRLYLEDCIRYGYGPLWAAGVPWKLINAAVDDKFLYTASEGCKEAWKKKSGREWENLRESLSKDIRCPACETALRIPWTTCGLPEDYDGDRRPGLAGEGYGDGQLCQQCTKCSFEITHDSLRVAKFWNDMEAHASDDLALPGTILDLETGLPQPISKKTDERLFPSQLAKKGVFDDIEDDLEPDAEDEPSMSTVREMAEKIIGRSGVKGSKGFKGAFPSLSAESRTYTKKMMARYWQNSSFAALDLCGAIMRLGVFSQKACKIDWLQKTASRAIMERLLVKYARFMEIIEENPDETAVPTLDVDLAWHTHQLSPKSYFTYTVKKAGFFIDHSDRVDEDKLSAAFEWTCKMYMEEYESPFSECTCWYCESIRTMNEEDILEEWHASGAAAGVPQPPTCESAHISAHPSVHSHESAAQREETKTLRQSHYSKLYESHSKAQAKAAKTGVAGGRGKKRMGPRGEDTFDFWGKPTQVEGPATSALAVATTAVMYATPPGIVECGSGSVASCPCGTCIGCGGEVVGIGEAD